MPVKDSYYHKSLRSNLVKILRSKGIDNPEVLEAINRVPRHAFMNSLLEDQAYDNRAFPISEGQTISQPYTVALQTQLLNIKKNEKVLEIGTGSGYQYAVLLELGASVYSIERNYFLFQNARKLLINMGYKSNLFWGDGYDGLTLYSPFDKIIITAAASEIPQKLLEQLKKGGKLVMPVGNSHIQQMTLVEKLSAHTYKQTQHGDFVFVPLLKGKVS